jgi:hypothetical protein
MYVKFGNAQHVIRAHSAKVGAIQQQIELFWFGQLRVRFKGQQVRESPQAYTMTLQTVLNTLFHFARENA